jgi:hypothetical protein
MAGATKTAPFPRALAWAGIRQAVGLQPAAFLVGVDG